MRTPRLWPRPMLAAVLVLLIHLTASAQEKKPNILVIFGDDIGQTNVSAYSHGLMGYRTPNIPSSTLLRGAAPTQTPKRSR